MRKRETRLVFGAIQSTMSIFRSSPVSSTPYVDEVPETPDVHEHQSWNPERAKGHPSKDHDAWQCARVAPHHTRSAPSMLLTPASSPVNRSDRSFGAQAPQQENFTLRADDEGNDVGRSTPCAYLWSALGALLGCGTG